MININKIIFFIIKSALTLVVLLTLVLFFYSAFFFKPSPTERKAVENQITKEEKKLEEEKEQRLKESQIQKKISEPEVEQTNVATQDKTEIKKAKTTIKDSLYATVGSKAIARSDIVTEIKIILILNGKTFSEEARDLLQTSATKSVIKRTIKQIEIEKYDFLEFSKTDLYNELKLLASNIDMDIKNLEDICAANEIDFSIITNQIETELLWNSLIFYLYKNRISINQSEIDEQLTKIQNKKDEDIKEYLISEIIIRPVPKEKLESKIKEIKERIKTEGFEKVAIDISISETATNGGDLGWVNQNAVSKDFESSIANTAVGNISEPILLSQGILIFMVRDKRKIEQFINLEEAKNQLVNSEKAKILNMYSLTHFDNIRRSISINYF